MLSTPVIGISACLVGERVRWDGADKRQPLVDELARAARLVPVCPEVELGLGVPREPIQLVRGVSLRLLGVTTRADHTTAMQIYAQCRLDELRTLRLSGYILKARSPSCGASTTPIFDASGATIAHGPGLFAAALFENFPGLPVVEEDALNDPATLDAFLVRARQYHR
jgi:uncharacterized protein YbbK (DUF523 family)